MADVNANIGVNLDTKQALAQLQDLQRRISTFHQSMARSGSAANVAMTRNLQQNLQNNINATGQFTASLTRVRSTTETFTNSLEKNKLSMGQYFRYGVASTKTFGKTFTKEMNTINKVAVERVKTMQTQYIQLGRDANGAMRAMAIRPAALDMQNLGTQTAIAAQKQQIFNQLLKQGSTNLLNFGKNTQWAGRQLMVGFTIPLGILGAAASRTFMEIEQQAVRFRRVYGDAFSTSGETEQALEDMKTLAEEFTKYGVAVEKTLGLAADAAQMGLSGRELAAQVTNATRLAVLGEVEQQEALQTSISITNAFGIAAEDLADKINFLNAVENESVTAISDLTTAIPKAGPVVEQLGGSVEDLAFFLTAMKEGGINATEGANALKSGLAKMINPTKVARDMLQGLGIDLMEIVESNAGDIKTTVIDFAEALDTLDPLNRARAIEQLFGKFQFARISTLFKNVVAEGNQAQRVLELSQATTEELAIISERELARVEESPMFKFQKQLESFQAALAPIGEAFLKAVTPIIELGTDLLRWFDSLGDGAKNFAVIAIGALGGIAPVVLMGFGLIANGIANLLKLFANLRSFMLRLRNGAQDLGMGTEYLTQEQLEAQTVAASLQQSHAQLTQTFGLEETAIQRLTKAYSMATQAQRMFAHQSVPGAAGVVRATMNNPMTTTSMQNPLKLSEGIMSVPGPKGAGDVVAAMLSPGEAVLPADRVQKYGALIAGIMDDTVPGYQTGNVVTVPGGSGKQFGVRAGSEQAVMKFIESLINAGNSIDQIESMLDSIAADLGQTSESIRLNKKQLEEQSAKSGLGMKGAALERAHLTEDLGMEGEDVRVVSNLTRDTLRSQNRELISGQDPDKFMEDWSSVKGGLFSTVEQGGLELTEDVRVAAQDLDDAIGKKAQEMAKAKGVLVDDSLLAEAAQEVINENKELTNEYGQVARTLEERGQSIGGRRGTTDEAASRLGTGGPGKTKYSVKDEAGAAGSYGRQASRARTLSPEEAKANRLRIEAGQKEVQAANRNIETSKTNQQSAEKGRYAAKAEADAASRNKLTAEQKANIAEQEARDMAQALLYNDDEVERRAAAARQAVLNAEKEEQVVNEKAVAVDKSEQAAVIEQTSALEEQKINDVEEQAAQIEVKAAQKQVETAEEERRLLLQLHEEEKSAKRRAFRKLESNMQLYGKTDGITSQEKSMRRKFQSDIDANQQPLTEAQKRKIGIRATYGTEDFTQSQRQQRKLEESKMRQLKAEERKAKIAEQQAAQAQQTSNLTTQETQKKRRGLGLLDRINSIRAKVANKEQMQSMQTRFGGTAMGVGMAASTVVGMGSMSQGPVGEISRQIMPAVMGISSAAMLINMIPAQMLSSFMTFLFSPMGIATAALVAVFGTLAAITISNNKAIKESRDNAYEFSKALVASKESAKDFAEAAGTVTRSEILERRRAGLASGLASPEPTFGDEIIQGEFGQGLVENINNALEQEGFDTASNILAAELNNAILQNAITPDQAKSVAEAVGGAVGDYGLSVDVMADISSWTMPNGEPLDLSQPIEADIVFNALNFSEVVDEGIDKIDSLREGSGEFIAWWDSDRWSEIAAIEGEAAAAQVNLLKARESGLDAIEQSYELEIDRLETAGKYGEAQQKQQEFEEERQRFLRGTTEEIEKQRKSFERLLDTDPARATAVVNQLREDIANNIEGGEAALKGITESIQNARKADANREYVNPNELVSRQTESQLYATLLASDATAAQIEQVDQLGKAYVDSGKPIEDFYSDLVGYGDNFGASRLTDMLDTISLIGDEAERSEAMELALNLDSSMDPRALDVLDKLATAPEAIRADLIVNFLGKTPEEIQQILDQIEKIEGFRGEELTLGQAENLLLTDAQRDILKSDVEYFESLGLGDRKGYLQTILETGVADTEISDEEARASLLARSGESDSSEPAARAHIEITPSSIEAEKTKIRQEFIQEKFQAQVEAQTDLQSAQGAVQELMDTGKIQGNAQIVLETLIADDEIGGDVVNLINNFSGDPATIQAFVNLRTRMGGQNTEAVLDILMGMAGDDQKANFISYIADLSLSDPVAAQEAIDFANQMNEIKQFATTDQQEIIDIALSDPDVKEEIGSINEDINDLIEQTKDQDKIELDVVRNLVGEDVADIIAEDQAYFDSLPKEQQIVYTQVLATLQVSAAAEIGSMSESDVLKEAFSKGLISGPEAIEGYYDLDELRAELVADQIAGFSSAIQAGMGDIDFARPQRGGSSGGGEQLSTTLDGLLGQLREFVSIGIDVREGWDAALQEIENFANGTSNVFNGLSQQLRGLGASQPLIDLIVGMSPEEFEERKNKLFKIKNGQIVGLKNAAIAIGEALNAVKIGSFLDEQQAQLDNTASQESAFQKLTEAGVDVAQAYRTIQNEALAAAIASTNLTDKELRDLADKIEEVSESMQIAEALESARTSIADFEDDLKLRYDIEAYIDSPEFDKLTESVESGFADGSVVAAAIFKDESLKALIEAGEQGGEEFGNRLKQILSSPEFLQGIFDEGYSNVQEAFGVQADNISRNFEDALKAGTLGDYNFADQFGLDELAEIIGTTEDELKNLMSITDPESVIFNAEQQIAAINYQIDDFQAGLQRIELEEEAINDKYDKRIESLENVESINESLARQQKAQLTIADALTRGDIAAAAKAVQEQRAAEAAARAETQKERIEEARQKELEAITIDINGQLLSREEIEERIKDLELEIFNIEEDRLEPAQRLIELSETLLEKQLEYDTVLGKTEEQWISIKSAVDNAKISSDDFVASMVAAQNTYLDLVDAYTNPPQYTPPEEDPTPEPEPAPDPEPTPEPEKPKYTTYTVKGGDTLSGIASKFGVSLQDIFDANPVFKTDPKYMGGNRIFRGTKVRVPTFAGGGMPTQASSSGQVGYYPMGGLIPYMSVGGMFQSINTDTVPAMLSAGEFVVRRSAVDKYGKEMMKSVNNGTYNGESVYNYSVNVNVKSDANANDIARTVMSQIRQIDSQRIRSNRF